jgi:hypothetical protein
MDNEEFYENQRLLGTHAMSIDKQLPAFRVIVVPFIFDPEDERSYNPPKRRQLCQSTWDNIAEDLAVHPRCCEEIISRTQLHI